MDSKHTPGPWELGRTRTILEYPRMCFFDREVEIYPPDASQTGGHQHAGPIALVSVGEDGGANARLIAAAPELLERLREASELLYSFYDHGGSSQAGWIYEECRKLIRRIEEGQ